MPIVYPGDPDVAKAPSPAPAVATTPIVQRPNGGEARNAASIEQALEMLTDHAAWSSDQWAARDTDFRFEDDFTGQEVDLGKWRYTSGSDFDFGPDANASGKLSYSESAVLTDVIKTWGLKLNLVDFRMQALVNVSSMFSSTLQIGILGANNAAFRAVSGIANWQADLDSALHDTGVAKIGGNYQLLTAQRFNGTFTFKINGANVYQETVAKDLSAHELTISMANAGGGVSSFQVDLVRLWHRR